jgi:thiosulfate reductase cytochrome b subunit
MENKIYLYPLWLRIWHIINALLFILLIFSGFSLHFSESGSLFLPFSTAIVMHNISGILLSLNYLFYFTFNIISGNYKHYIPKLKRFYTDIVTQTKFYLFGIFNNEPHPFPQNKENKFNPLQKLAYLSIMYGLVPLIVISGWLLMFPEFAPDEVFGMGGVWPMALLHTIVGFMLTLFMFSHIYLGTTGHNLTELYKSILTGWHLEYDQHEAHEAIQKQKQAEKGKKKLLPGVFYNPITLTGAFIIITSFSLIIVLTIVEFLTPEANTYVGIITFIILPGFLMFGLLLSIFGLLRENRRLISQSHKERKLPVIDMNNAKHQIAVILFSVGAIVLVLFTAFGSFKAYEYTESDEFCGEVCHAVMEPEYVTYKNSAHNKVGCAKCHIGSGADWYVKSKLSGLYQVYAVLTNVYPRPIPTPIHNLRPAQQTCEQCHSPKHFYDEKKIVRDYYLYDSANSHFNLTMHIKVGGGNQEFGNNSGIHWNMNLANEIHYIASDKSNQIIPWVKSKSLATGKETVYRLVGESISQESIKPENMKLFDCIDCHNRPAHRYNPPDKIVNLYLNMNRINPKLPFIKSVAVQALESINSEHKDAIKDISSFVWNYYNNLYPNLDSKLKKSVNQAIDELAIIYSKNYFPHMKANWKIYPDNIGHIYSPGCFRCHDGKHVNENGKILTNDCNACHTFQTEFIPQVGDSLKTTGITVVNDFVHPGGADKKIKEQNCVVCHGVSRFKKTGIIKSK